MGTKRDLCFNPLDRGNLYQIKLSIQHFAQREYIALQSPRSGKFVSDLLIKASRQYCNILFQSPRSGKFVSDIDESEADYYSMARFNPLDRGNLYQIWSRGDYRWSS